MLRPTMFLAAAYASAIAIAGACSDAGRAPTTLARPGAARDAAASHGDHGRATGAPTVGQLRLAQRVKEATARFADTLVAQRAGYTVQFPAGCAAIAGVGAQGYHFLDESLVDHRTELMKPELVMYEPQADGSYVLVGVDYVIPFSAWKSPTPPNLLGQEFGRNEPLGVWALHIWTERANPNGLFAAWNPDVSCANARPRA